MMQSITRKEFLKELDSYLEKKINLKISGYINLYINLQKFNYHMEADVIKLIDNENNNYITINLNEINSIIVNDKKIICYLNDRNRYNN